MGIYQRFQKPKVVGKRMKNRICALPDELLLEILLLVPTKYAVRTTILSKRWRYVWTMLPKLKFKDKEDNECIGWFIDNTLQLHKAPKLESLIIKLGPRCPIDVNVRKWVKKAVKRRVNDLDFNLLWNTEEPTSFPKRLYTCDTLDDLTLSNKILVNVSSSARLPSLISLSLVYVVYKDEESLVRLLSNSPVLEDLRVKRYNGDNLTNFTIKVSSLQTLYYTWRLDDDDDNDDDLIGSTLVIDTPALTDLTLVDVLEDDISIENNMPCLNVAVISFAHSTNPGEKFLTCISFVIHLQLFLTRSMEVAFYDKAIRFTQLKEFYFSSKTVEYNWLEPLMFFLQNSPKLKTLTIDTEYESTPPSWNQSSSIPGCLSSHLEIFVWRECDGREDEKQLVKYILANSKCLKTMEISFKATCNNPNEVQKELESVHRISTSSCLLFPTEIKWRVIDET